MAREIQGIEIPNATSDSGSCAVTTGAASSSSQTVEQMSIEAGKASSKAEAGIPDSWVNLDELAAISPIENRQEGRNYRHKDIESVRNQSQGPADYHDPEPVSPSSPDEPSRYATQIYTHSYLVFFSILGTLARKGLSALTTFAGMPVVMDTIWVNFAGCVIMGFLVENRKIFMYEWGTPKYHQILLAQQGQTDDEAGYSTGLQDLVDLKQAKEHFDATKKSIPLYVGLATGFCGSFTTFAEFVFDGYLAIANQLPPQPPFVDQVSRNGGYSFMALLGTYITTICLSISGLMVGAHLALALEDYMPSVSYTFMRRILDRMVVLLGWGCWIGAVMLCIFPPHDVWRGRVTFALAFAPLGVFARFHLALLLNGKYPWFPLGTFAANVLASAVLASTWDLNHSRIGGLIGCQVFNGVAGGFSGCLSTVSTWVVELTSLQRKHSYLYGAASVLVSFTINVVVSGIVFWGHDSNSALC